MCWMQVSFDELREEVAPGQHGLVLMEVRLWCAARRGSCGPVLGLLAMSGGEAGSRTELWSESQWEARLRRTREMREAE